MASPTEIRENLPDTLPEDFGEWDSADSSSAPAVEAPGKTPAAPRETPQREFARREAEALDLAKKPQMAREVSREFEASRNVTPFPEPEEAPSTPRGIPAPVIRAPRNSPTAAADAPAAVPDETTFVRRMKSLDTVVDKLPAIETPAPAQKVAGVTLVERVPDKPLFSSAAAENKESGATLLNDLLDDEEEKKTRRKWITTGCIFGGSLLLVAFQLFHYYGSNGKLKHIVPAQHAAAVSSDADADGVTIPDAKQATSTEKPSAAKTDSSGQPTETTSDATPASETQAPAQVKKPGASQTQMMQTQLSAPTRLPDSVKATNDAPPPSALGGASIAAFNGNSAVGNVFSSKSNVSGPKQIMVSAGVASGMLTRRTQPIYPSIARSARVQGTVTLQATITASGKVANIKVLSGPPMLRQSAVDAVKTWQYKPYTLNGYPTDVDTTINLVFSLGG